MQDSGKFPVQDRKSHNRPFEGDSTIRAKRKTMFFPAFGLVKEIRNEAQRVSGDEDQWTPAASLFGSKPEAAPAEPPPTPAESPIVRRLTQAANISAKTETLGSSTSKETAIRSSGLFMRYLGKAVSTIEPLHGFLVSFDQGPSGEVLELREGRWEICASSGEAGYDSLATLRVERQAKLSIVDQFGNGASSIWRWQASEEIKLEGSVVDLQDGDTLCFGKRKIHVTLIKRAG